MFCVTSNHRVLMPYEPCLALQGRSGEALIQLSSSGTLCLWPNSNACALPSFYPTCQTAVAPPWTHLNVWLLSQCVQGIGTVLPAAPGQPYPLWAFYLLLAAHSVLFFRPDCCEQQSGAYCCWCHC
jgi:hypothetical protein